MRSQNKQLKLSMSSRGLRIWGIIFLVCGMISRAIIQNRLLNVDAIGMDKLTQLLQQDPAVLKYSTMAVLLQGMETIAAPIFAFLLVEGFLHTSEYKAYLTRVFGAAVLAEIPYNLMSTGKVIELSSRNPMFSLAIGLIAMLFYNQYEGTSVKNILTKCLVCFAASLWTVFLGIQNGLPIILMVTALSLFSFPRGKQVVAGIVACVLSGFLSPYFYASTLGMLMLLLYTGERSYSENKWVNYLSYPVLLLAVSIAAMFM